MEIMTLNTQSFLNYNDGYLQMEIMTLNTHSYLNYNDGYLQMEIMIVTLNTNKII